jgi:hypothetical protein
MVLAMLDGALEKIAHGRQRGADMTIWGLTLLDLGALAFFLLLWLGYAPFLAWRGRRQQMIERQ